MRLIKMALLAALIVVSALFGYIKIQNRIAGVEEGPVLSCNSEETLEISVKDGEEALLAGMTAYDAQDGDLTGQILVAGVSQLITADTAKVTYLVFDSHDNMAEYQRYVRYTDYRRPRIHIESPLIFASEETVGLLGCLSAQDVVDGDITQRIRLSNLWVTEYANVFSIAALVTNSMGDTMRLELPVLVQEELPGRPEIRLKQQILYLQRGEPFDAAAQVASVVVGRSIYPKEDLVIEHQVDTTQAGTYWVHYWYTTNDIQGTAILTVVVL